jgi:hypothetical protein
MTHPDLDNAFPLTDAAAAAIRFVNNTASHIFLTGKAGTGKTTFLRNLAARTHKSFIIVAPTGIAALNAGGVTIHSQFLFPFGMFVPEHRDEESGAWFTASSLPRKHPLNSARKQVLRSIDLLVIDEVSMLRADLLDAIDYRLKAAKGNFRESFGGVQLLLIGDLYQLPPVVTREDEGMLRRFYKSPWFFEARAFQQDAFVYIELDKIFRQNDDLFINLLNNLRNNQASRQDIEELNRRYVPPEEIQNIQEVITLTTHNYKADELNQKALNELKAPATTLEAIIKGEFPTSMYPTLQYLELKPGAQVMFIKNDSEDKAYFNGKLATVTILSDTGITVTMADTHTLYTLKREVWENKKYTLDEDTKELHEEVMGTFEQYPVKLAWAITVHKSQGLTFDRAIIDIGQAFADGQVYVALSRLRSLEGLIMRTRLDPAVVSTDQQIVSFTTEHNHPDKLPVLIKDKQQRFILRIIQKTFDFSPLINEITFISGNKNEGSRFNEETMRTALDRIRDVLLAEAGNTERFRQQLITLLSGDSGAFLERLQKGSVYYRALLETVAKDLLHHLESMRRQKGLKGYVTSLTDLDQLLVKKLEEVDKALHLTESILEGHDRFDFTALTGDRAASRARVLEEIQKELADKPVKKQKRKKKDGPSTYDVTLELLERGLSLAAIASERSLTPGTIEGHLAKAVGAGRISIFKFMAEENVEVIMAAMKELPEGFTSKDLFSKLKGKYGYGQLRAVINHVGITLAGKPEY